MKAHELMLAVEKTYLHHKRIPAFAPGDVVKVHVKIKEKEKKGDKEIEKERIQVFEGVVIGRHGSGTRATFKVRRIASGVGVERTFVVYSPLVDKIEVVKHGHVARAKLFYLRGKTGKKAKVRLLGRDKLLQLQEDEMKAMEAEREQSALQAAAEAAALVAEAKAADKPPAEGQA